MQSPPKKELRYKRLWQIRLLAVSIAVSLSGPTAAAELIVSVFGVVGDRGTVGCALYSGKGGFPMDPSSVPNLRLPADPEGVQCTYPNLTPGTYAVAVSQDFNGNEITDTNVFGIPKEPWGVSNNVRPTLRPPRIEEAQFTLEASETRHITIELE